MNKLLFTPFIGLALSACCFATSFVSTNNEQSAVTKNIDSKWNVANVVDVNKTFGSSDTLRFWNAYAECYYSETASLSITIDKMNIVSKINDVQQYEILLGNDWIPYGTIFQYGLIDDIFFNFEYSINLSITSANINILEDHQSSSTQMSNKYCSNAQCDDSFRPNGLDGTFYFYLFRQFQLFQENVSNYTFEDIFDIRLSEDNTFEMRPNYSRIVVPSMYSESFGFQFNISAKLGDVKFSDTGYDTCESDYFHGSDQWAAK